VKHAAVAGVVAGSLLVLTPLAFAADTPPVSGPDTQVCTDARAALDLRLAAVLDLSAEVLDGADETSDLTPGFLDSLLADDEAGEGAQVDIRAAITAWLAVDRDCAAPVPPTTTTPPTTPPPTTATATPEPTLNPDDDDDFDQVGTPPRGPVATGGR